MGQYRWPTSCIQLAVKSRRSSHAFGHRFRGVSTHTPVAIVGGGPSGLALSNLLSYNYKVPNILLERQSVESRFRHPQAHFLNTRTMEILRHWLPDVYRRVQQEMPPVDHWSSFRFVANMSQKVPIAEVVHPVDRPLQAGKDANGILKEDLTTRQDMDEGINGGRLDLSVCRTGHLAQQVFGRILYDHAISLNFPGTQLLYDTNVKELSYSNGVNIVKTDCGQEISADFVVAADGSDSFIRKMQGIQSSGTEGILHLINVHVRLPADQAQRLHAANNHAMLYSIFCPDALATVVCHSVGEYIIQIPYFPPYQTLEQDFGKDEQQRILQSIFGPTVDTWEVLSVGSWTMSALVADMYCTDTGIALVGDAAHVFPPAGGFGMNTGIQDCHNLAWRIARAVQNDSPVQVRSAVLKTYEKERRPVALSNAALSRRNYKRLLEVVKAAYFDEKNRVLFQSLFDWSPLPLDISRAIFQSSLKAIMYPLRWLDEPGSFYARHIGRNLRAVLRKGAGLPLLFPDHEIGFSYAPLPEHGNEDHQDWRKDAVASQPSIEVGKLLPHSGVSIVSTCKDYPGLQFISNSCQTISTSDLPIQLARENAPIFVILVVGYSAEGSEVAKRFARGLSEKVQCPVEIAHLVSGSAAPVIGSEAIVLRELEETVFSTLKGKGEPYFILIRPDGHVSSILSLSDIEEKGTGCSSDTWDLLN